MSLSTGVSLELLLSFSPRCNFQSINPINDPPPIYEGINRHTNSNTHKNEAPNTRVLNDLHSQLLNF